MQFANRIAYIRTSVKALILHQGKVLVIKEKVMRGGQEEIIYDFPGGGIEKGEELEAALRREVLEEVGLQIDAQQVVGAWEFFVSRNPEDIGDEAELAQIVCIGYQCRIIGDSTTIDIENNPAEEEIFDYEWLTPQEILERADEFDSNDMIMAVKNLKN